jgi:hypothetical protein
MRKGLVATAMTVGLVAGMAASAQELRFTLQPKLAEVTPFVGGDELFARADGQVDVFRGGRLVATLVDRDGALGADFSSEQPLYVVDAEGFPVWDLSRGGALFLTTEAPAMVHLKRGLTRPGAGLDVSAFATRFARTNRVLMTFHNGAVLTASKTMAIFWGPQWTNASFAGDKISGLDSFFSGFGGSNFAGTTTEYYGSNGQVTRSSAYLGHSIDTTNPPSNALSTSQAVSEACKIAGNNPDPSALYLIYTSTGAGNVNYCAWHSWGTCSGSKPIQVAYMPNIDGIAGCDPGDTWTTHSQGLAAVANVTSHELAETITDPRGAGWYDSSGAENGDKCAWAFQGPVTLTNSSVWKLQMEWSNAAYTAGTGYPNLSGQKGCLQGQ